MLIVVVVIGLAVRIALAPVAFLRMGLFLRR